MNKFFGVIFSIVTIITVVSYCLAAVFAPFGIVWLVLNH